MMKILLVLIAFFSQVAFGAAKKAKGREKTLSREATSKKGDRAKIDFESTDIDGQRKMPLGTILNNTKSDPNYNFVKIRLRWHPEMIQSASSLESGRTLK